MTTVTLDVDDVEALLFSVNAIQGVEAALKARDIDSMVRSASGRLSQAHDRVAAEWRRAKRPDPERPDTQDLVLLHAMFNREGEEFLAKGWLPYALLDHYPQRLAQTLQLVESGPYWEGRKIDWPAPNAPEFTPTSSGIRYAARLTPRGVKALEKFVGESK